MKHMRRTAGYTEATPKNRAETLPDTRYCVYYTHFNPFKDETQTALFKDPVRTAL